MEENNTPQEFKTTLTSEQLASVDAALTARSYSERHPELGKMVNCAVCGRRHRSILKCEQRFAYTIHDTEYFKEEKDQQTGEVKLVPAYRTAEDAAILKTGKPTKRSIVGAAAFKGKRINPHPSKVKLQFIERTKEVFLRLGFDLDNPDKEQFQKDLHRARIVAARELRKSREERDRKLRRFTKESRKINR